MMGRNMEVCMSYTYDLLSYHIKQPRPKSSFIRLWIYNYKNNKQKS